MVQTLKNLIKSLLGYRAHSDTGVVRAAIDAAARTGRPYCPPDEGDLMFSLIRANRYRHCLETGFHTGSTALYMAAAVAPLDGDVVSICVDDDETIEYGLTLLQSTGQAGQHRLVRANSNRALFEMFREDARYGFVYVDGWKTFDHLAMEIYLFNQMLETGGTIFFDDTFLPSVRKAIRLLRTHYGYREVDYGAHGQRVGLRLYQCVTRRSVWRPYRAFTKTLDTATQEPMRDWAFYRRF